MRLLNCLARRNSLHYRYPSIIVCSVHYDITHYEHDQLLSFTRWIRAPHPWRKLPCACTLTHQNASPYVCTSPFVADKMSTKDSVLDHRCALTARVLTHLPLKIAQSGRRRKIQRVRVEKRISFPGSQAVGRSVVVFCAVCKYSRYCNVVSRKRVQCSVSD